MLRTFPLLSILIATKNRIPFCISAIKSILTFTEDDFELIIQDNSDTKELSIYIDNNVNDIRVIYNYTPPPFSSIDNFNAVISLARGEYVCLIGDDDGVNPEIFKLVRWAKSNDIAAIVPSLNANYRWPDSGITSNTIKEDNGVLTISTITGKVNLLNTSKEILKLMRNGGQGYLNFHFSKIYHGIVKKEFMEKIKSATGNYFGGLSPDIYSSVALTLFIDKIIKIDYPLTIAGICNKSTSADSGTGKHSGKLEDAPHLRSQKEYHWAEQVPKFYSVETIWADSAIAALRDMNRFDLLKKFNLTLLTVFCLKNHRSYSKIILKHYFKYYSSNKIKKVYRIILLIIEYFGVPILNLLFRAIKKITTEKYTFVRFGNIENISQAEKALSHYLSDHFLTIDMLINELNIKLGREKRS